MSEATNVEMVWVLGRDSDGNYIDQLGVFLDAAVTDLAIHTFLENTGLNPSIIATVVFAPNFNLEHLLDNRELVNDLRAAMAESVDALMDNIMGKIKQKGVIDG